jgi:hypothetical protein
LVRISIDSRRADETIIRTVVLARDCLTAHRYNQFRKEFKTDKGQVLDILDKVLAIQAFVDGVLRELMPTPKMKVVSRLSKYRSCRIG